MELNNNLKERLVILTNKAIDGYHAQFKKDTKEFMYHYAFDNGTIYLVHHMPAGYHVEPSIVDITVLSRDLALLSYLVCDIINQKYFKGE